jgi:nucleoside-diphosphate-sugar epimerase
MIVAITGATGFIGRSLVSRLLSEGATVRALSRRPAGEALLPAAVRVFPADLTQSGETAGDLDGFLQGADVLVHCAGEITDGARMRALHVNGTQRLVEAARSHLVRRWVQLSSVGAYGAGQRGVVLEDTALAPVGEYESTKTEADRLVVEAAHGGAFEAVVLRPSTVFGPSMPNQSLYQLIAMIEHGWFAFVGAPGNMANYVFVDDVADALWLCATSSDARGVYNLSDDRTMETFIGVIAQALQRPTPSLRIPELPLRLAARVLQLFPGSPLTVSRVEALTRRTTYPASHIRQELGFEFRVSIEEGLRRLVEDWRRRL